MTTTATHNEHDTTTDASCLWRSNCAKRPGSWVAPQALARSPASHRRSAYRARLLQEVAQAKRRSLNFSRL